MNFFKKQIVMHIRHREAIKIIYWYISIYKTNFNLFVLPVTVKVNVVLVIYEKLPSTEIF